MPYLVEDDADHHLQQIRAAVLRVTIFPQVISLALEVDARRIEEGKGEVGKEVLPSLEELLLHDVLHTAGREGRGVGLIRKRFAEPCHRPVEMVKGDIFCPLDPVVLLPFVTRAVGAGFCQAVEHRKKKRPFEGELELAAGKKIIENFPYAEFIPETAEDERYADLCIFRRRCLPLLIGIQKGEPFGEPGAGAEQAVNGAAFFEEIGSADGPDDLLLHLSFLSPIADNLEILPGSRFLSPEEHITTILNTIILPVKQILAKTWHYEKGCFSDYCPKTRINTWVDCQKWGKTVEDEFRLSANCYMERVTPVRRGQGTYKGNRGSELDANSLTEESIQRSVSIKHRQYIDFSLRNPVDNSPWSDDQLMVLSDSLLLKFRNNTASFRKCAQGGSAILLPSSILRRLGRGYHQQGIL